MNKIALMHPSFDVDACMSEIRECLETGWTGPGFKTTAFEEKWKEYTGLRNAYFVNSCTASLNLTFDIFKEHYGWNDDDEIITTPLTFVSSNHSILLAGLKPVFADVDGTFCLDPADVERKITSKTKAVLFVGICGNPGNYDKILEICKKHDLKLVVDAAHMAGTKKNGIFPCGEADSVNFSFQIFKTLPTADSGMLCLKDKELEEIARIKAWSGINTNAYSDYALADHKTYKWHYDVPYVSNCYNGNSIMAAIGLAQLRCLDSDNEIRRAICRKYDNAFGKYPELITLTELADDVESARCYYQIVVKDRDNLAKYLAEQGINSGVHYIINTNYRMYSFAKGLCKNAEYISEHILTLPLFLKMTEEETEYVIKHVIKYVTENI